MAKPGARTIRRLESAADLARSKPVSACATSSIGTSLPKSASSGSVPTAERRTSVAHGPGTSTTPGQWPAFAPGSDGSTYIQPKTRKCVLLLGVTMVVGAGTSGFHWCGGRHVVDGYLHA